MAKVSFRKANTKTASSIVRHKMQDGKNRFRIVGDLLPRYQYWLKNPAGGSDIPFEALDFDPETELFSGRENPVKERFPDVKKPKWAYACQVINRDNGNTLETMTLLTTVMEQIIDLCDQLEVDPNDPETGIEFVVMRKKTGPKAYNVEYSVQQLASKSAPMSDEDREIVANGKTIEEVLPRETVAAQNKRLDKLQGIETPEDSGDADEAAADI